jgi:superfamily I DNA and RNA helicase
MQGSWWKDRKELDVAQQKIILLPADGNHLILGPPGCGKTNLLLLRGKYLSSSDKQNLLFLTFGRSLSEFIRTGVGEKKLIDPDQIMTFRKWTYKTIQDQNPALLEHAPEGTYEETREFFTKALEQVTKDLPRNYYDAILVDEVQDLTETELNILASLTTRLTVAGDSRQRIFAGAGIVAAQKLNCSVSTLEFHYRIGHEICKVSDKVLPPTDGVKPLLQTSQYHEAKNPSRATSIECKSFEEQLEKMAATIRTQLKAFPNEAIGILVPTYKHDIGNKLQNFLRTTEFTSLVGFHDENERGFDEDKRIFVLTCHSAKGTEFRAVHLLAVERMRKGYLARRTLAFTAFTRAKTSLMVYYTGDLPAFVKSAFAKPIVPELDSLFQ